MSISEVGHCGTGPGRIVNVESKKTAAQSILELAEHLACTSESVAAETGEKLHPICSTEPVPEGEEIAKAPEYPPYFEELRTYLSRIDYSLCRIRGTVDRCEL